MGGFGQPGDSIHLYDLACQGKNLMEKETEGLHILKLLIT